MRCGGIRRLYAALMLCLRSCGLLWRPVEGNSALALWEGRETQVVRALGAD